MKNCASTFFACRAFATKNPLPAQVKGFTHTNNNGTIALLKALPHIHVQPVTRGFETFVSVQQSGRSPGL